MRKECPAVGKRERQRKSAHTQRERERERARERERESTRVSTRERERERERERKSTHVVGGERENEHFGSSFYMFFLPLGLPYVNWVSQECCLFYLKSSLQGPSFDLPLTFLCSIFSGFSLPFLLATAILDSCFLF